jgi:hypothetical protein
MIWAGWVKDLTTYFSPDAQEDPSRLIKSKIIFRPLNRDEPKEIAVIYEEEEGIANELRSELKKITSRKTWAVTYTWDRDLYYYLARYGRVLTAVSDLRCWDGYAFRELKEHLGEGTRVGILDTPKFHDQKQKVLTVIISKGKFCEIPRSSLYIEPKA